MASVTRGTRNTSEARRQRNARGEGANLRTDLLDATLSLLGDTGDPEDVSIRGVAKAVGVSPTAVYQHFADRDEVLTAACDRAFELFAEVLVGATSAEDDPFDRLAAAGEAYLAYAAEQPGLYRVLFSNPLHLTAGIAAPEFDPDAAPGAGPAGSNAFDVLVTMVQACLDAGAPAASRPDADARYLSYQVWTWMHGIADLHITHPFMDWPDARRMVADVAPALGLARP